MSLRTVLVVFRKELLDVTRDRRTLMFMILLPLLVIPLLMTLMTRLGRAGVERAVDRSSPVAILGARYAPRDLIDAFRSMEDGATFERFVARSFHRLHPFVKGMLAPSSADEEMLRRFTGMKLQEALARARRTKILKVVPFEPESAALREALANRADEFLRPAVLGREDGPFAAASQALRAEIERAIRERRLDAVLVFHPGFAAALARGHGAAYTLITNESEDRSSLVAQQKIIPFFERGAKFVTLDHLERHGIPTDVMHPVTRHSLNVGREANFLARLLPYLIILMCFAGSLYPALDLAAGEKERGTLETLLVSPARRLELVLGKFLVVLAAALTAAVLSVVSMSVALSLGFGSEIERLTIHFDPRAALVSILLMIPTAAIFAALLLSLSIFARSFKEAQSYTVPINLLIIVPAVFSMLPGFELTPGLAFVPVVNVSMALKEAWFGIYKGDCLTIIVLSTLVYAGAALSLCAWWFRREAVLFRS